MSWLFVLISKEQKRDVSLVRDRSRPAKSNDVFSQVSDAILEDLEGDLEEELFLMFREGLAEDPNFIQNLQTELNAEIAELDLPEITTVDDLAELDIAEIRQASRTPEEAIKLLECKFIDTMVKAYSSTGIQQEQYLNDAQLLANNITANLNMQRQPRSGKRDEGLLDSITTAQGIVETTAA